MGALKLGPMNAEQSTGQALSADPHHDRFGSWVTSRDVNGTHAPSAGWVCGKRAAGASQPDRDQIENRLTGQQLSMISRRYMRDLRNSATIETR